MILEFLLTYEELILCIFIYEELILEFLLSYEELIYV